MSARDFGEGSSSSSAQASGSNMQTKLVHQLPQLSDSLYEVYKPLGNPSMQIVFVHGIHSEDSVAAHLSTWESHSESEDGLFFWPQRWLAAEFPSAHIFTAKYSGGMGKSSAGKLDIYLIAENLLCELMQERVGQMSSCPVVLVGHCFGGIVIKQLCVQAINPSRYSKKSKAFIENVRGVFYYGTPHHGFPFISEQADLLQTALLNHLRILSMEAARLKFEFDLLRECHTDLQIHGIGESLPTKSTLFPNVVAVPEPSAREGDSFSIVKADHISISKPASKIDTRFSALKNFLHKVASTSEGEARECRQTSMEDSRLVQGSSAVTTASQESHKRELTCPCDPQHLTVSCTPEPSEEPPTSSSSQGEHMSKSSTRKAVGDSYVTMPITREGKLMPTGADKRISMRTFSFSEQLASGGSGFNKVSLKISAYTSLTCCLKSDPNDKKVCIEFSTIGGKVKIEDNVNLNTNTVVLRSVRSNVNACIIRSGRTDHFEPSIREPLKLYVQESDARRPWRKVLETYELFDENGQPRMQDDLVWMQLSGNHPQNSELGSITLELQCHVKNRVHYDLKMCCHDAHVLEFTERDPVILEGKIPGDLKSDTILELNVQYQVVVSYDEPLLPKAGQTFVVTKRKDKTVDFDFALEFRTRKFSSWW